MNLHPRHLRERLAELKVGDNHYWIPRRPILLPPPPPTLTVTVDSAAGRMSETFQGVSAIRVDGDRLIVERKSVPVLSIPLEGVNVRILR